MAFDMNVVRTYSCMEGHSVDACAFRQLPSLFSVQIAKRMIYKEESAHSMRAELEKKGKKRPGRLRSLISAAFAHSRDNKEKIRSIRAPSVTTSSSGGGSTAKANNGE